LAHFAALIFGESLFDRWNMFLRQRKLSGRVLCRLLLVLAAGCAPGCASWNLQGDGFQDHFGESARKLRPAEKDERSWGVSAKSREIERNFGYAR
jgi:hypothetical protein